MYQIVNLSWKIAVQSAGCVSAYVRSGYKNSLRLWFWSSFKVVFLINLEGHKIVKFAFGNVSPKNSSQFKSETFFRKPWCKIFLPSQNIGSYFPKGLFKKILWNILSNSQGNTCVTVSLSCNYIHTVFSRPAQVFPINFRKFLRTSLFSTFADNTSKYLIFEFAPEYCYCYHLLVLLPKKWKYL